MWSFSLLEKLTSGIGRKAEGFLEERWGLLRVRPRPLPGRRRGTPQSLVTRRAPPDSRTQAQKNGRSGFCPTSGAPGRGRALVSSGAWKGPGAGVLRFSSWGWTRRRARLFSGAGEEGRLTPDLRAGPLPLPVDVSRRPNAFLVVGLRRGGPGTTRSWKVARDNRSSGGSARTRAPQGGFLELQAEGGRSWAAGLADPARSLSGITVQPSRPASCSAPAPRSLPSPECS